MDIDIDMSTAVLKHPSTISSLEHQNVLCVPQTTPALDLAGPCPAEVMLSL
jgi:hypothetical protein